MISMAPTGSCGRVKGDLPRYVYFYNTVYREAVPLRSTEGLEMGAAGASALAGTNDGVFFHQVLKVGAL